MIHQSVDQPPSQLATRSPVKISVKELLLSQTPKTIQDRMNSHELGPGGRVMNPMMS